MNLSPRILLDDCTRSTTAARLKLDNTPPMAARELAGEAAHLILERIWDKFGDLHITSGYRSPDVNKAVGGSLSSDHQWTGANCAFDFQPVEDVKLEDIYNWIRLESDIPFDQCFLERGKALDSEKDDCIHIGYRKVGNRRRAGRKPTGGGGQIIWDTVATVEAT